MPQSTWTIQLHGDSEDLEHLERRLKNGSVTIKNEKSGYFMYSDTFANVSTAQDVLAEGERIAKYLSGILKLRCGSDSPLKVGHVDSIGSDGSRQSYLFLRDSARGRDHIGEPTITVVGDGARPPPPPDTTVVLAELAAKEQVIETALRLYAHDSSDWVGLYRIFEVVEADAGGKLALVSAGWTIDAEIRSFKHTANSPTAIGDAARHGSESRDPPKNPMSFEEAKGFIGGLMKVWLKFKDSRVRL